MTDNIIKGSGNVFKDLGLKNHKELKEAADDSLGLTDIALVMKALEEARKEMNAFLNGERTKSTFFSRPLFFCEEALKQLKGKVIVPEKPTQKDLDNLEEGFCSDEYGNAWFESVTAHTKYIDEYIEKE